jgi:hypothetical protein
MSEFVKGEDYPTADGESTRWSAGRCLLPTVWPMVNLPVAWPRNGGAARRGALAGVDDGSSLTTPGSDKWELGEGGGGASSARGPTARVPRGWQEGTSSSRGARGRELLIVLEVGKGGMEDGCDEEREDADLRCHSGSFGFCISAYACCWTYYSRLRVSKIRMRGLLGPLLDIA